VGRRAALALGLAGHCAAVVPMVGFAFFLAGFGIPKTVDSGAPGHAAAALAVDLLLLGSFAVVHSLLARDPTKAAITRWLPVELERSLYSLVAGIQIVALLALWRPLPELVWTVEAVPARTLLYLVQATSWLVVLAALAAVGSGHLFGWRQARAYAAGRPYQPPAIAARGPYRLVRHPLYAATIVAMFAAPDMSRGHLLLAGALTLYILIGLRFEERDLERRHGEAWRAYRRRVPALVPGIADRRAAIDGDAPNA
jgi:protein-S-isoprenylcysteine O-methyltransferase Ste14